MCVADQIGSFRSLGESSDHCNNDDFPFIIYLSPFLPFRLLKGQDSFLSVPRQQEHKQTGPRKWRYDRSSSLWPAHQHLGLFQCVCRIQQVRAAGIDINYHERFFSLQRYDWIAFLELKSGFEKESSVEVFGGIKHKEGLI